MSRIGKLPVTIPEKVTVEVADSVVRVKGPKGELEQRVLPVVEVKVEGGSVIVERKGETKPHRAAHGLTRTLVANMVEGVSKGFRKSLEIQGVGYRAAKAGNNLNLTLGYDEDPRRVHRQAARRPGRSGNPRSAPARTVQGQRHPLRG